MASAKEEKKEIDYSLLSKIAIHRGSITDLKVDCIVNAANSGLWGGAGVCGVIFRKAGYKELTKECDSITDKYGNIPTGQSVITNGYRLYAKYIIHCVGPIGENQSALQKCYQSALDLCIVKDIKSIAFPCISTGIFGFSKSPAAAIALNTVKQWLKSYKNVTYNDYIKQKQKNKDDQDDEDIDDNKENDNKENDNKENDNKENENNQQNNETVFDRIDNIIFCCFDIENWRLYEKKISQIFPSQNDNYSYLWSDKLKAANKILNKKLNNENDDVDLVESPQGSDNDD